VLQRSPSATLTSGRLAWPPWRIWLPETVICGSIRISTAARRAGETAKACSPMVASTKASEKPGKNGALPVACCQGGRGVEAAVDQRADLDGAPAGGEFGEEGRALDLVGADRDGAVGAPDRDAGDMRLAGSGADAGKVVRFDRDLAGAAQRDAEIVALALLRRADGPDGVAGDAARGDAVADEAEALGRG
jgi:hypothetical protein